MSKAKKLLSIVLAVVMTVSLFSFPVFADTPATTTTWSLSDTLATMEDGDKLTARTRDTAKPGEFTVIGSDANWNFGTKEGSVLRLNQGWTSGSAELIFDLPAAVTSGKIVATFGLQIEAYDGEKPFGWGEDTALIEWVDAGFANGNAESTDDRNYVTRVLAGASGIHKLDWDGDLNGTSQTFTRGQWYYYVLTADLDNGTRDLVVYNADGEETNRVAEGKTLAAGATIDRFRVRPVFNGSFVTTDILIRDLTISTSGETGDFGGDEPATSTPAASTPVTSEPVTSEPATSEPATSEPATSEPATSEPATSEPETSEPATSEPATSEPETSEPETSEPETSEPETSTPAVTGPTIQFGNVTCDPGQDVTVSVQIVNNPGTIALMITPQYDAALGTAAVVDGGMFSSFTGGTNYIWSSSANVENDGKLFDVSFTAPTVAGTYSVSATFREAYSDMDGLAEMPVTYTVQAGSVTVTGSAASTPETSEPETSEPATSEPETSEPETSEPAASTPATSEPAASTPVTSVPTTSIPTDPNATEWRLTDQIKDQANGTDLTTDADTGVYAALNGTANNTAQVVNDGTNVYLKTTINDSGSSQSPKLVLNLPQAYGAGELSATFYLMVEPNTQLSWVEMGFGNDGGTTAPQAMFNQWNRMQLDWSDISGNAEYTKGTWYRFELVADLGNRVGTLEVYTADGIKMGAASKSFASNKNNSTLSQFIVVPFVDGSSNGRQPDKGVYNIKDLVVKYTAPQRYPNLLSPEDGGVVGYTPSFTWSSTGATSYDLVVSPNANYSNPVLSVNTTATSYAWGDNAPLTAEMTYYWKVTANYDDGGAPGVAEASFSTVMAAPTETRWVLNDQIVNIPNGGSLPIAGFEGIFGGTSDGPSDLKVVVAADGSKYLRANVDQLLGGNHRPQLSLQLPEAYVNGTLTAEYDIMLEDVGTQISWIEAGFGTGDAGNIAKPALLTQWGNHAIEHNHTVCGNSKGSWYHIKLETNLSLKTTTMTVYLNGVRVGRETEALPDSIPGLDQYLIYPCLDRTNYGGRQPDSGAYRIRDLVVTYKKPSKSPILMAPEKGALMVSCDAPKFVWTDADANSYTLEIAEDKDMTKELRTVENITASSYTWNGEVFKSLTDYYWRIIAHHDDGDYQSEVSSFTTSMPKPEDDMYYVPVYSSETPNGLVPGEWWNRGGEITLETGRRNAQIIQSMLDLAGQYGGGTIVLPEGEYCLAGDYTRYGQRCLYINYDNITMIGQGRDAKGNYKTILNAQAYWDGPNDILRCGGIRIQGTPFGSGDPRKNIRLEGFEMDGGRGWNGKSDWGYDKTVNYGWDVSHQGIVVAQDDLVTHVVLNDLYVHDFSGETLYVGGQCVGYLEVTNCTMADTNASCFNLNAAWLNVQNNQFGAPGQKCRFWIEYCPRVTLVVGQYGSVLEELGIPSEFTELTAGVIEDYEGDLPTLDSYADSTSPFFGIDTAYFANNTFYNTANANGVAIAQGNSIYGYTMIFENNVFDNRLDKAGNGIFQFAGALYGPTIIRNNVIQNTTGPVLVFSYGGNTVNEDGVENVHWVKNKNIWLDNNYCTGIDGKIIDFMGSWGAYVEEPITYKGYVIPTTQPIEDLYIRGNYFAGKTSATNSVVIGNFHNNIQSAVDMSNVQFMGNYFTNCIVPKQQREFLGNAPYFKGNSYVNTIDTQASLMADKSQKKELAPIYEYLNVRAFAPVTVDMVSTRYHESSEGVGEKKVNSDGYAVWVQTGTSHEDGQRVTIKAVKGTKPFTFGAGGKGYSVPRDYTLEAGDQIVMEYSASDMLWKFVSFTAAENVPTEEVPAAPNAPEVPELDPNVNNQTKLPTSDGYDNANNTNYGKINATADELPVTVIAGEGGTVTPVGVTQVKRDQDLVIAVKPDAGNIVGTVLVNGKEAAVDDGKVILENVQSALKVEITFVTADGKPVDPADSANPADPADPADPDATKPEDTANPSTGDAVSLLWTLLLPAAGVLFIIRRKLSRNA